MAQFDAAKAMFVQADTNHDGRIDQNEFRNWAVGATGTGDLAGGLSSSSYESSSYQSSGGFDPASAGFALGAGGYEAGSAGFSSQTGFESAGGLATGVDSSYATASLSDLLQGGGATVTSSSAQQVTDYSSQSSGRLYNDPNPQIIRRAAVGGALTYKQNIVVRFLQPPPVPPPGPLIIKEVRPPQPPPPPPLIVRQRAAPLPQPPPLILRERPPIAPAAVASETVIRRLPAIPVPPRSVIIERLPPLPPKPRDIIIERWVSYGAAQKRQTIVQRAAPAVQYPKPRNVIIVYDAVQARVIRQFQRFGVTPENPQAYLARHGASLLDASSLVQKARSAGVIEDISPPAGSFSAQFSSSASQNFSASGATSFEGSQGVGGAEIGPYGLDATNSDGGGDTSYSSESFSSSSGFGGDSAFAGSVGVTSAGFAAADTNHDGGLDRAEFERFYQGGL